MTASRASDCSCRVQFTATLRHTDRQTDRQTKTDRSCGRCVAVECPCVQEGAATIDRWNSWLPRRPQRRCTSTADDPTVQTTHMDTGTGAVLHSSNEPGELSQWLCHDDSTINIVLDIILLLLLYYYHQLRHHDERQSITYKHKVCSVSVSVVSQVLLNISNKKQQTICNIYIFHRD